MQLSKQVNNNQWWWKLKPTLNPTATKHTTTIRHGFSVVFVQVMKKRTQKSFLFFERFPVGSHDRHMAGRPLAEGWFACLWALIGDLEYLASILSLPSHNNAKNCCALCKAGLTGSNTWSDFRPTAGWRAHQWTYESWRSWPGRSRNQLFTLPGVSALNVHLDWMHSKYLGIDQFTFGSCLALLTCTGMVPGSEQAALDTCWKFIQDFYREHKTKVRFGYLNRLSMFLRQSGCPKLRGKAAEIKHFVYPLLSLWELYMNSGLKLHRQIRLMLKTNAHLEDLLSLYEQDVAFPPPVADDFEDTCCTMLCLHGQIASHFAEEGTDLFNLTGKAHMVQHISLLARCISPRQATGLALSAFPS